MIFIKGSSASLKTKRMKKKLNIFSCLLLFMATMASAKPEPPGSRHFRTLYFYTYGTYDRGDEGRNACYAEVMKRYGIAYTCKAGCCMSRMQVLRYNVHNLHVQNRLRRRFGDDWEQRFKGEIGGCGKET